MSFRKIKNTGSKEERLGGVMISTLVSKATVLKDGCPNDMFIDLIEFVNGIESTIWNLVVLSRIKIFDTNEGHEAVEVLENQLKESINTIIKTERKNRQIRAAEIKKDNMK